MITWFRGLWQFYLAYTKTGVHAAAAAALAIFGILVFVDGAFAILAIASYVLPPVVLYVRADDAAPAPEAGTDSLETPGPVGRGREPDRRSTGPALVDERRADGRAAAFDGDTDSDSDDGDTDSDSDDGDTDTDSDG
ncbi:hypothetical protein [Natronococcus sp. JC468]|uniref:hypothetical protein n=1 Tax=Natronococcus sp. JC468 TaxID=1961921 RepID=UPI0028A7EEF0|nr:hypothetical protein [Natronococcus sp. JC468]